MKRCVTTLLFVFLTGQLLSGSEPADISKSLALELSEEKLHTLSALEFRRCAYEVPDAGMKAGFLIAAAWEYFKADQHELSHKTLDRAESFSRTATHPALLIRGEVDLCRNRLRDSGFFFSTLAEADDADAKMKTAAFSRLAVIDVINDDLHSAKTHLTKAKSSTALKQLELYAETPGKSPRVGGLLGMIPGLGYAYSGEYANAARSLIINGIFIYAMKETADRKQWGAFTALTFFELTWYTGSIYGGIDSAHRFNRRMRDNVTDSIMSEFEFELDLKPIPTINIEFRF